MDNRPVLQSLKVHLFEDADRRFHYQVREFARKNAKHGPALCGASVLDMREAAWFDVGDRRGAVHYERGCDGCRKELVI